MSAIAGIILAQCHAVIMMLPISRLYGILPINLTIGLGRILECHHAGHCALQGFVTLNLEGNFRSRTMF